MYSQPDLGKLIGEGQAGQQGAASVHAASDETSRLIVSASDAAWSYLFL